MNIVFEKSQILIVLGVCSILAGAALISKPNVPVIQKIDLQYAADFSDDTVLVGASHNIFIGTVTAQVGTTKGEIGPETQFQVQVVDNIKGNLKGTIVVDQQGGVENGVMYVIGDEVSTTSSNSYLLRPGATYLLATRYNPQENWYTLNPYPTASKLISSDSSLNLGQLKALAAQDERVQQLRTAYPHEKLLDADIKHGNTPNSYASIQAAAAKQAQ